MFLNLSIFSMLQNCFDIGEKLTFLCCKDENVFLFLLLYLQVHSGSCILTKETIADCFLWDSNRAMGHCSLSLECWSSQNASLENTNLVKKGRLALSGIYIDTPKKRAVSALSLAPSLPFSYCLQLFCSTASSAFSLHLKAWDYAREATSTDR